MVIKPSLAFLGRQGGPKFLYHSLAWSGWQTEKQVVARDAPFLGCELCKGQQKALGTLGT